MEEALIPDMEMGDLERDRSDISSNEPRLPLLQVLPLLVCRFTRERGFCVVRRTGDNDCFWFLYFRACPGRCIGDSILVSTLVFV